ncbi:hypothetical protein [Actinocatenispora comari]|uniref:Uncharacterized protein n=1 Tax=Actinocatenispora comari TaxID=2807577 RepID=A0A8J4AEK0_9ACTN|nr:hypothetical protein [Actinocatenispora comari]GIL29149.1 hypothetical protein NUM_44030 [Actinocatenispora comari]
MTRDPSPEPEEPSPGPVHLDLDNLVEPQPSVAHRRYAPLEQLGRSVARSIAADLAPSALPARAAASLVPAVHGQLIAEAAVAGSFGLDLMQSAAGEMLRGFSSGTIAADLLGGSRLRAELEAARLHDRMRALNQEVAGRIVASPMMQWQRDIQQMYARQQSMWEEALRSTVLAAGYADSIRSTIMPITDRLAGQTALLAGVSSPLAPAARAATGGWIDALNVTDHEPTIEALEQFGHATESVNTAAYLVRQRDTPTGTSRDAARGRREVQSRHGVQIEQFLAEVDQRVREHYDGIWDAMTHRGPAWPSAAAHHAVEVLDGTLRALAPHDAVLAWRGGWPATTPRKAADLHEGRPTRALRVRYIAEQRGVPASTVDYLASSLRSSMLMLQGVKHAGDDTAALTVETLVYGIDLFVYGLIGRPHC